MRKTSKAPTWVSLADAVALMADRMSASRMAATVVVQEALRAERIEARGKTAASGDEWIPLGMDWWWLPLGIREVESNVVGLLLPGGRAIDRYAHAVVLRRSHVEAESKAIHARWKKPSVPELILDYMTAMRRDDHELPVKGVRPVARFLAEQGIGSLNGNAQYVGPLLRSWPDGEDAMREAFDRVERDRDRRRGRSRGRRPTRR